MKSSKLLALSAITLLGFSACQKPELESELTSGVTHTVTFVAGAPETKTTVTIEGNTAMFAWTEYDESRFTVYENGTAAKETIGVLGKDGKMTIKATFEGPTTENASYVAVVNKLNDGQIMSAEAYDEDADILVSKAVSSFDGKNGVQLQFKREVAIAKMTLKGLDPGEVVNMVTVSSTSDIAGSYGVKGWASPAETSLEISSALYMGETDGYSIVANEAGEAVVWFTCIPQTDATLTVKVEAADGDTYTKKFSKPITLTKGDVKGFGVAMNKLVDPHKDHNGWFLVKDARFLAAGDVIRIGCASKSAVAGSLSVDYLSGSNATYSEDNESINSVSSSEDFTLGGSSEAWTLTSASGTLGATAVKKLTFDAEADSYVGTWSIAIAANGDATISPQKDNFGRILCNAGSSNRFTTYTSNTSSSMILPGIYKKYGTPAETKKDQAISFDPTSYTATIGKENTYPSLTAQSTGARTWSSSKTDVATINESTGEITLVAAGKTTISVTVAGDDTYNEGKGSYELTVEDTPVVSTATWSLVTDASTLAEGDVIVIVAASSNVALSTTQNSSNRGQQEITKNANSTITIDDKVQQLTLGAGTKTGTFSLSTGAGYLYAASSSKNYLKTQTTLDDNGSWTITIASNKATIKANGTYTRNWLRYNSTDKLFSCYSSGQGDVQIYRKNDTRASQSISYSAETGSIDKYTLVKNIPTLNVSGVKTTVSYTSSNEAVATVSETGEITPLKAGTTTITAIAVASAEYREAKTSFVLTVTDSSPYLNATASKTSIAAAGETVKITVDTNVDSWTASSDNAAFVVGTPSGNTVDVVVSKNTDATERTATITVTAGTLSKTIALTQSAAGAAVTAKQYTLTITPNSFNTTSYAANNNDKTTQAVAEDGSIIDVTWYSNQIMLQSNAMQWQKNNAYLYNKTDLGEIKSVTVNSTAGTFTTYYGSTQNPTSGTIVGGGYFNVKVGSATGKTNSVVVVFKK